MKFLGRAGIVAAILLKTMAGGAVPFFDPTMPIHATPVDAGGGDVLARGLLIRAGDGQWMVFDQDLLRPAIWFPAKEGKDPLTLEMMAQSSWHEPTRKSGVRQPKPVNEARSLAPALPGVAAAVEGLLTDPRPVFGEEPGRGGLEQSGRRFLGYHAPSEAPVLSYQVGETVVREWYEADDETLRRHLAVAPGEELVFSVAVGDFALTEGRSADGDDYDVSSNHAGLTLETREDHLIARLAASTHERRVTLVYSSGGITRTAQTPAVPSRPAVRWPDTQESRIESSARSGPGWALDQIGLPEDNPWKRRMRPADLAFLSPEKAAVVTFEGDVWQLDLGRDRPRWRRIAAGLSEPLAIGQLDGVPQVFTRNGLVRLRDLNDDGETDFYENHSSLVIQTAGTRGYPLDMEITADGRTLCSVGGIVTDDRSFTNKLSAIPHAGAILSVSPDGREIEVVASQIREPFIALDPETGRIVLSDQQGHYVPTSGIFGVTPGTAFGYGGGGGSAPVVWIPHEQDNSSASPQWVRDSAFEAWNGGILNLSYGTGRLFLIRPDGEWPATRGAAIPLGIETEVPLLHSRIHPGDGSLWLAGFRIYDSRVRAYQGLARLRPTGEPLAAPVDARIFQQGVVLTFGSALEAGSIDPEKIAASEWQYRRSSGYGSPRLKRDGSQGIDRLATGGTWLSKDGKSVFVHIPGLQPTMQLELRHEFRVEGAESAPEPVYFSAVELLPAPWIELGFDPPELEGAVAGIHPDPGADVEPTVELGSQIATRYGCIACHAVDDAVSGQSGPSWIGLFGSERKFKDGTSATADADYLREAILEPEKQIVEGYELGMASYAGVLSEAEIESLVLYIESLR